MKEDMLITVNRGALSVGLHMLAYNGRDDKLFSGAIAESGAISGVGLINPTICNLPHPLARISESDRFSGG